MAIDPYYKSRRIRNVIHAARRIVSMLQGTMSLEGQGLSKTFLAKMKRQTVRDLWKNKDCNKWQS